MKRFTSQGGDFIKNEVEVGFDSVKLDMSAFVHPESPAKQSSIYSLYAVTVGGLAFSF